ncbi:MAG: hypothetical protein IKH11_07895 [Bacteroidales bacterium]|nr:hypothetical protein [Bacteroidales bacterium]
MEEFEALYSHDISVYNLPGFRPQLVDSQYLEGLGVRIQPSPATLEALERGSRVFMKRFEEKLLIPRRRYVVAELDPLSVEKEIHNYTGRCPTLTWEINPVRGCGVGCQYCLVSDGVHEQELVAWSNYHLYVRRLLEEQNGPASPNQRHYYYFSPKTEALQEASLYTGIAHKILHEFIAHFERFPDSQARLFIASKAGVRHLEAKFEGESILSLFTRLRGRMQFNTSVSIMPDAFRDVLEPYAAPLPERLAAVRMCRDAGIAADSALVQPILTPWLTPDHISAFFDSLNEAGIVNYKPEFLTACVENLAMLGQYLGTFDKSLERQLYEDYLMPSNEDHRKQRGRIAPSKPRSIECLERMIRCTEPMGMSVSICYWVRKQLGISEEMIPLINRNGFQCLGYQSRLFGPKASEF